MISVGIDPALNHTGFAFLRDGELERSWTFVPEGKGIERLVELKRHLSSVHRRIYDLRAAKETVMWGLEDYAWALGKRAHQMGEWGGQIRLFFYEKNEHLWILNQSEVKKFATGTGRCKKEYECMRIAERWQAFRNSDEAEAFVIAKMLFYIYALSAGRGETEELTKYQHDVLRKHVEKAMRNRGV